MGQGGDLPGCGPRVCGGLNVSGIRGSSEGIRLDLGPPPANSPSVTQRNVSTESRLRMPLLSGVRTFPTVSPTSNPGLKPLPHINPPGLPTTPAPNLEVVPGRAEYPVLPLKLLVGVRPPNVPRGPLHPRNLYPPRTPQQLPPRLGPSRLAAAEGAAWRGKRGPGPPASGGRPGHLTRRPLRGRRRRGPGRRGPGARASDDGRGRRWGRGRGLTPRRRRALGEGRSEQAGEPGSGRPCPTLPTPTPS